MPICARCNRLVPDVTVHGICQRCNMVNVNDQKRELFKRREAGVHRIFRDGLR